VEKYWASEKREQVPCFSHSCCQNSSLVSEPWHEGQTLFSSERIELSALMLNASPGQSCAHSGHRPWIVVRPLHSYRACKHHTRSQTTRGTNAARAYHREPRHKASPKPCSKAIRQVGKFMDCQIHLQAEEKVVLILSGDLLHWVRRNQSHRRKKSKKSLNIPP
jgi:hypothetical protein